MEQSLCDQAKEEAEGGSDIDYGLGDDPSKYANNVLDLLTKSGEDLKKEIANRVDAFIYDF